MDRREEDEPWVKEGAGGVILRSPQYFLLHPGMVWEYNRSPG